MMTRKQIEALKDISDNSSYNTKGKYYGEAKTSRGYLVTDGYVGVVYPKSVPELAHNATLRPTDYVHNMIESHLTKGNYRLVDFPFSGEVQMGKIRKQISEHSIKEGSTPFRKTIDLMAHLEEGTVIVGRYNTKFLLNAINAVSDNPMMYIGTQDGSVQNPYLIICSDGHICDFENAVHAVVMPIRMR